MASIPGVRFDITGASGSQGVLAPQSSWRAYVLPRGGHISVTSAPIAKITFDSADVASRFSNGDWIQMGLSTDNIRQLAKVGGNSITYQGTLMSQTAGDRVYLIGQTQPTVTGGSATYTTPASFIYSRDDDTADLVTNSMLTSDSNGTVQFWAQPQTFDIIIQDGDQTNQGSILDVPCGAVEGVSTTQWSHFGATVTITGNLGVSGTSVNITGWLTCGSTVTVTGALGVTGTAYFGDTTTIGGHLGVTGYALFGDTVTVNGQLGVTGWATCGSSLTVTGNIGTTGHVTASGQPHARISNSSNQFIVADAASWRIGYASEDLDVGGMADIAGDSRALTVPQGGDGTYLVLAQVGIVTNQAMVLDSAGGLPQASLSVEKNQSSQMIAYKFFWGTTYSIAASSIQCQALVEAVAGDSFTASVTNNTGTTFTTGGVDYLQAIKLA